MHILGILTNMEKTNIRNYWNYSYYSNEGSEHFCDCNRPKDRVFTHGHKTSKDDVVTITLNLCSLCYTRSLFTFFTETKRLPQLRCEGSQVRSKIIDFLEEPVSHEQWEGTSIHKYLDTNLPHSFHCSFYQTHSELIEYFRNSENTTH